MLELTIQLHYLNKSKTAISEIPNWGSIANPTFYLLYKWAFMSLVSAVLSIKTFLNLYYTTLKLPRSPVTMELTTQTPAQIYSESSRQKEIDNLIQFSQLDHTFTSLNLQPCLNIIPRCFAVSTEGRLPQYEFNIRYKLTKSFNLNIYLYEMLFNSLDTLRRHKPSFYQPQFQQAVKNNQTQTVHVAVGCLGRFRLGRLASFIALFGGIV